MENNEKEVLFSVSHLKKYFQVGNHATLKAVDDVSFEIYKGETLGMVGESGCGKTTCGRTCIGLYDKTDGQVLYKGTDVHALNGKERFAFKKQVQMVFQDPYGSLDPRMTVADIIGEGNHAANAQEAIEASYADDKTDEFVLPCVTCEGGRVQDGDTVIFMNFRPDRARQMTRIFCDDAFTGFERRGGRKQVHYVCMAEYDATMPNCEVAYPPVELKNVLGQYLSENGKTQLRIAETEKYAHVTFFFNGGVEAPYDGEDRCVIPSPKVATYDLKPEMSAPEVADECVKRIESGKYDVVILNFANCDMVGHTGVFEAAVKAVEAVDAAVEKVVTAVLNAGGCAFLTADHGNAEKMKNPDGTPFTAHTTNVVPFVAIGCGDVKLREGGCLADIAPTMLPYIGLPVPAEMTGKSIIAE